MAIHSVGMMRRARDIAAANPGNVAFLDFGDRNFDEVPVIEPTTPNRNFWRRAYKVALDNLATLVVPKRIVTCAGHPIRDTKPGRNHGHDAACYNAIFGDDYPNTHFVSIGSDQQIIGDKGGLAEALRLLIGGVAVTRLIDRDDTTPDTANRLRQGGVRVLSRRNLESYPYDDEIEQAIFNSKRYVRYGARVFPVVKSPRNGYSDLPLHIYYTYQRISELTTPGSYSGCVVMDANPADYPCVHVPGAEPAPTFAPYGK